VGNVSRTVYGIYYPETRRIVDALWAERPHALYERNYTGRQDAMHHAFLARWRAWVAEAGVSLGGGLANEYPTAGANEAIHALLAQYAVHGARRLHVLEGDYEGYAYTAEALRLEVVRHARDPAAYGASLRLARPGEPFFVSQPSAIDGNLWPGFEGFRDAVAERAPGVELVVDLTYVGAVNVAPRIDLDHEAVRAVVFSLSKPFGVYYHRIGGVVSRAEIATLRGHLWFKNLFSVVLGERLMASHPARDLPARYRAAQVAALERCRTTGELPASARASDVVMLAHAPHGSPVDATFASYARANGAYRFCLSPAIDAGLTNP
jgi:histidinol-phosphate/aromatic aminotransferase/cobyric acid decarboxylase-like protein